MDSNFQFLKKTELTALALTPDQEQACQLLADGWSQTDTAEKVGVTKQTINRWLKRPTVRHRIQELRIDVMKQVDEKLRLAMLGATDTIIEIATGGTDDDADTRIMGQKLKAALWILDRALRPKRPTAARLDPREDDEPDVEINLSEDEKQALLERAKDLSDG